jgi:hypothetical protein
MISLVINLIIMQDNSKNEIVNVCKKILDGRISISAASLKLRDYRDDFDIQNYDDILLFNQIASETEQFPFGVDRQNWNQEILEQKDKERATIENSYKERVVEACQRLIEEFSESN